MKMKLPGSGGEPNFLAQAENQTHAEVVLHILPAPAGILLNVASCWVLVTLAAWAFWGLTSTFTISSASMALITITNGISWYTLSLYR